MRTRFRRRAAEPRRGGARPRRIRLDDVPARHAAAQPSGSRSTFLLTFLTSFDEFIAAFFLTGTNTTLPLFIWSQLRFPELPGVMALGSIILALSIIVATVAEILRRRGLSPIRPRGSKTKRKPNGGEEMTVSRTSIAAIGLGGLLASWTGIRRRQAAIFHLVGLRAARLQQELPRRASGRRRGLDLRRRRRRLHQGQGRLPPRRRASLLRQGRALEQGRVCCSRSTPRASRTGTRSSRSSRTCPTCRPATARCGWCRGTGATPRSSTAPIS